MRKIAGALLLSVVFLPLSAGAMVPEGTAHIAHSISDIEEHSEFSFSSITEGMGNVEESTLYFNDGFGRLTEFRMTCEDGRMALLISQNGREVYRTALAVKSHRFSVVKREEMGEIYFLITLGEHAYRGAFDREDRWHMEEYPQKAKDTPMPL